MTGRPETEAYLRDLGATRIIPRADLAETVKRPLEAELWAGCIDAVGGPMLARVVPGALAVVFLMGCHSTLFGPVKYAILPQHLEEDEVLAGTGWVEAGIRDLDTAAGQLWGVRRLIAAIPGDARFGQRQRQGTLHRAVEARSGLWRLRPRK